MRKLAATALLTAASAATALGLSASPALADPITWTVNASHVNFTGSAGTTTLKDEGTGKQLNCTSSNATGHVTFLGTQPANLDADGDGVDEAYYDIAEVDSLTFNGCTGPFGISFTVTSNDLPWIFTALSYSGGVTTGELSGVSAHLSGSICSADVDGPDGAGTDSGVVTGTYNNSTHVLTISGGNLKLYNVSNCLGQIVSGDDATFNGAYTIHPNPNDDPQLTITSP